MTADMATAGGFGGALGGADGNWKSMVGGGIVGAAVGAAIGSMVKVNNYAMIIDIQVSEQVEGGVKTQVAGQGTSGGGTGNVSKSQAVQRDEKFLHHRTRIATTAKQTNLKFEEAIPPLTEKVAASLAGVF